MSDLDTLQSSVSGWANGMQDAIELSTDDVAQKLQDQLDRLENLLDRIDKAKQQPCVWTRASEDEPWRSACGIEYSDEDGNTPKEAGMDYCYHCGHEIEVRQEAINAMV